MASTLQPTHPLQSRMARLTDLPDGLGVHPEPFVTMTTLHLQGRAALDAASDVLGVAPPSAPNTWVAGRADVRAVIWMGPDEWLVISEPGARATQEGDLRAAVVPHGGAAVDVSGQRVTLVLDGTHHRDVLSHGCALDLHPSVFGPGRCAQTTVARAGVVLLADTDPGRVTVLVRQSFAAYLIDWILDASQEYREPE